MRADERMKAAKLDDAPSHISVSIPPQPAKSESEQFHVPEMHAGNNMS